MREDRPCGLCGAPVTRAHVLSEKTALFRSKLYCPKCAGTIERLRRESILFAEEFDRSAAYACSLCEAPVPPETIAAGKTLRRGESVFCWPCSGDVPAVLGRVQPAPKVSSRIAAVPPPLVLPRAAEEPMLEPEIESELQFDLGAEPELELDLAPQKAEEDPGVAICASCSGLVTQSALESGDAVTQGESTLCKSCRPAKVVKMPAPKKSAVEAVEFSPEDSNAALPIAMPTVAKRKAKKRPALKKSG